jgi:peptide deformylase
MGHPVLRERARPVEKLGTPELRELPQDMQDTMARRTAPGSPRRRSA